MSMRRSEGTTSLSPRVTSALVMLTLQLQSEAPPSAVLTGERRRGGGSGGRIGERCREGGHLLRQVHTACRARLGVEALGSVQDRIAQLFQAGS
eukprot:12487611-Heterocapsa_arctica.AAC.1